VPESAQPEREELLDRIEDAIYNALYQLKGGYDVAEVFDLRHLAEAVLRVIETPNNARH
jgi:hypothetical protein